MVGDIQDQSCVFCTVASGSPSPEASADRRRILKEGEYMYVIFSNPRLMPGHLLVIAKRHVTRLSELTEEERRELLDFIIEFEGKILEKLAPGCDIRQNYKPYIPDSRLSVKHLHFHLNPRYPNDELYEKVDIHRKPMYQDLPPEEKEKLFKLFME